MLDLTPSKAFDPHLNPRRIVLVGVGGTGAHLARLTVRLLAHMHSLRLSVPSLCLIDPDLVEAKNVGRQLFAPADVGAPKAELTARRLSLAFGLPIEWVNAPFVAEQHLRESYGTVVLEAVDNEQARRELARLKGVLVIACGNAHHSAQVSIGTLSERDEMRRYLGDLARRQHSLGETNTLQHLPTVYALFPDLLEPEAPTTSATAEDASCADLILREEQSLLVNDVSALIAARYLQQVLFRQPIHSFLSFANLQDNLTIRAVPNTLANLNHYLQETET